ncbi:hypothetical protein [Burkholderia gladioli]|uniref:hypothetical protein n=1 Tax=Burkholderia gladioli TaxID=28095 RepID=UPI0034DB16B9
MNEHEKIPAQGGEMPPVERAAITGSGGIDTVRGATPAGNAAQERNTTTALTDEQINAIANDGHRNVAGGIYAHHVHDFARDVERALVTAPRAGLPRHVLASLECTAVWLEKGNDPQDAARELRACLAKIDAAPARPGADPLRRRVERLLVELHAEGRLSEGQCAKMLDIPRIDWRELAEFLSPDAQAVAADGAQTKDVVTREQIMEWARTANIETGWFTEQLIAALGDFAILARAAVSPAPADVAAPVGTPFSNCRFRNCDLPGQCKAEGKCHHPIAAVSPATADRICTCGMKLGHARHCAAFNESMMRYEPFGEKPATADAPPDVAFKPWHERHADVFSNEGDAWRAFLDARATVSQSTAEKVYYGGSVEAGPVAFDEPATADERAAMVQWATERWDAEVKHRPLINVHRRALDDTWRQVIRHCGGDDVSLLGPRHDALLAANPIKTTERDHSFIDNDLDSEPDAQHAVADMANIGYALMQTIERMVPGYCWNESPTEIVSDLINERDEARASQAAAPAEARELIATFDDGLKVRLDSWTGGRHEAGSFGEVTLRFTDERHTTVRDYRAKDIAPAEAREQLQARVQPWMMECFGPTIAADRVERNHRFLEEALELVQSLGCTASEAHQLVDYTFGRPVGEPAQEVGGVMVTLAALCLANALDMHAAGETELARISEPATVLKIRAKQAAKPKHSPLPQAVAARAPYEWRDTGPLETDEGEGA